MKKFIGLLSKEDAEVIEKYAREAQHVLEFGAGGSTHIIAQSAPLGSVINTLDTKKAWLDLTRQRLERLNAKNRVKLRAYTEWPKLKSGLRDLDLIFVDGEWAHRRTFAFEAWPLLRPGGHMLFHDTRRKKDIAIVAAIIETHYLEIESIQSNEKFQGRTSNITAIQKKIREPEVNWYKLEGKPQWAYGLGPTPAPESFWRGK